MPEFRPAVGAVIYEAVCAFLLYEPPSAALGIIMKLCELKVGECMRITALAGDENESKKLVGRGIAPEVCVRALMRRADCGIYFIDGAYFAIADRTADGILGERV